MKIFAHRGSSLMWPENTLLAFNLAHKAGATGFETDLRLSKDHQIFLSHDDTLVRFGYPDKVINELTSEELCNIEISSLDGRYSDKLITLKTLLKAYPNKDYIFDCKISDESLFKNLKNLLSELRFHNRIWFLTWSQKADNHVQKFFPGYNLFPRATRTRMWGWSSIARLGYIFEPKNQILSLPAYHFKLPVFSKRQIASIHRREKTFVGYLINTENDFKKCKACGVQIVLTDRPDLLIVLC
ncbi:MAG: glycerophosphodiester phosphodiesterase [bacterium]